MTGPGRYGDENHHDGAGRYDDVAHARAAARNAVTDRPLRDRHDDPLDDRLGPPRRSNGRNSWQVFVHRWGWRAYALPILVVITIAALVQGTGHKATSGGPGNAVAAKAKKRSTPPPAQSSAVLKQDVGTADAAVLQAAALPAGPTYDTTGDGTYRVLKGTTKKVGSGTLFRYSIDVENGLTGVDLTQFQTLVDTTLADKRSWSGHGVALQRVDSGPIDFHITLTASMTVRKLCGYDIRAETSCYVVGGSVPGADTNRVVLNIARWTRGAAAYVGDLAQYRLYMINHEDGHALGHMHAHQCLPGGLAPAMMQQTFGLRSTSTDKFCQANPWPYPPGVSGAPGAEQQDTAENNEYGRGD